MKDGSDQTRMLILEMLDNQQPIVQIEQYLLQQGHEEKFIKELIPGCVALRNTRRRAQGMALILAGAVVCFVSFLLTITSSFTHFSFPLVLYGLTSVGILLVFAGFTRVF